MILKLIFANILKIGLLGKPINIKYRKYIMLLNKIIHYKLYEYAINQIYELIKNNTLKPGDKIPPERDLVEFMGISRSSLREGLRVLEARGVIKSKPGGGRFIREIDKESFIDTDNIILRLEKTSILELLEAREVFELKIVEFAVKRASKDDIDEIQKVLIKSKKGKFENSINIVLEENNLDRDFHLSIARASHNFIFVNLVKMEFDLLENIREKTWKIPGRKQEQYLEHLEICKYIKEHNSKRAVEAMQFHLNNIRKAIINFI